MGGGDDLDEDTNIIQGMSKDGALDALFRAPAPSGSARDQGALPSDAGARSAPKDDEDEEEDTNGMEGPTVPGRPRSSHPAQEAGTGPAQAPEQAAAVGKEAQARLKPLPAVRVAVVGMPGGEVRLIALGPQDQAPAGAPIGILVPSAEADGAAIAKLLGISL